MHGDPAANIPWLYTREPFALKGWATPAQLDAYRGGSVTDKRALLDELRSSPLQPQVLANWKSPRALDIEWFASAYDLCKVLKGIATRARFDTGSELLKILAINPGVPVDGAQFRYVGYKGGSEVGVLNLSWLVQRVDGRWFVVVITLNDNDHAIDENVAAQLGGGVLKLLGAAP